MAGAGCLDLVALDGEIYQVQTELTDPVLGRVRTVIFHEGSVVAVNETELRRVVEAGPDVEVVRAAVEQHHQRVLRGFVARTSSFLDRLHTGQPQPAASTLPPVTRPTTPAVDVGADLELPPLPEDPALADGLDVRALFATVWRRIGGGGHMPCQQAPGAGVPAASDAHRECLERALEALAWALERPALQRARIDEQARFHLLHERIRTWADHGRDGADLERLKAEVIAFCTYVSAINNRADLLEFDRALVCWARRAIRRHGATRATLKPVAWLLGRDGALDDLIAEDREAPAELWLDHLDRIWSWLGHD